MKILVALYMKFICPAVTQPPYSTWDSDISLGASTTYALKLKSSSKYILCAKCFPTLLKHLLLILNLTLSAYITFETFSAKTAVLKTTFPSLRLGIRSNSLKTSPSLSLASRWAPISSFGILAGAVKVEKVVRLSVRRSGLDLVSPCRVAIIIGPNRE